MSPASARARRPASANAQARRHDADGLKGGRRSRSTVILIVQGRLFAPRPLVSIGRHANTPVSHGSQMGDICQGKMRLAVVILVIRMKVYAGIFYSPIFFVSVVTVLILLSYASHKYLEMPAQRWIRANFAERRRLCRFMDFWTKRLAEK
jgi:hypothetical protein